MAPNGKSNTTVVPIIIPCACSYLITVWGEVPTTTAEPDPELEVTEEPEPELVGEEEEEPEDDDMKGLEFEDMEAAKRLKSNWRVLSGECCASVYEVEVLSTAEPIFQAAIQGEEVDVEDESSFALVPVPTTN
jgi:hypothetical protein